MKQIIALGGGGFSMEPDNPLLDNYIVSQSKSKKPKVCFIPTASGDAEGYIQLFYKAFEVHNSVPSHLSLFRPPSQDLEDYIMEQDILYVGGGNTRNLLVLWKEWEVDQYIKKAWENGTILSGLSAGSICWFDEGVTDSLPDELTSLKCLGLIKGSNCPHYDGEADRRPSYHKLLAANKISNGLATDDGVALHYRDNEIFQVISSRPQAKAYKVEYIDNQIIETVIEPIYLGKKLNKI